MSGIFLKVVDMSVTATVVSMIVMAVRILLKSAPKIFSYALWSVVFLRLVIPFSIESSWGIIKSGGYIDEGYAEVQNISEQTAQGMTARDITGGDEVNNIPNNISSEISNFQNTGNKNISVREVREKYVEAASNVWVVGIAIVILISGVSYFRLKRKLRFAWLTDDGVFESDRIHTPFVLGFIKPRVYLPAGIDENEKRYILVHENKHISRCDYLLKPAVFVIAAIHWFNPVIWIDFCLFCKDMEMSCDEWVLKKSEGNIKKDYADSLLNMSVKRSLIAPLAFGEGDVKERVNNILKYKNRKTWLIILLAVIVGGIIIALSVNGTNKDTYTYESSKLGYKLELPDEWKDKAFISGIPEEWKNGVQVNDENMELFFAKKPDGSRGGHLFSINREIGEIITEEDINQSPVPSKLLMRANGYTYYATFPSDVQYDPADKEETESYMSMNSMSEEILKTIKPYGDEKPAASNKGYKVVGNSFFTLEIPEDLEMEAGEFLSWNFTKGGDVVGSLSMFHGRLSEEDMNGVSDFAYFTKPDSTIYTCIAVNGYSIGESAFNVMKNTFGYKTSDVPVTVLDYIDTAEKYIDLGGSRLFGKITDISPVSYGENMQGAVTTVELMDFVRDENQPNGFKIVDLNETRVLESGYGGHSPDFIPLVPPNYNTLGVYVRYLLDEKFIEDYGDENKPSYYKNFYYDFILHPDGTLLLIKGHYIP